MADIAQTGPWDRASGGNRRTCRWGAIPASVSLADAALLDSGEDALVEGGKGRPSAGTGARPARAHRSCGHDAGLASADHVAVAGAFGTLRAGVALVKRLPPRAFVAWRAAGDARAARLETGRPGRARPPPSLPKSVSGSPGPCLRGAEFAVDLAAGGRGAKARFLHLDPRAPLASVPLFAGSHAAGRCRPKVRAPLAELRRALLRHHNRARGGARPKSHDWAADPHSLGPWRPGAAGRRTVRARPMPPAIDGRLLFAGEAVPGPMATTLGGAWAAGLAAADEIWHAT